MDDAVESCGRVMRSSRAVESRGMHASPAVARLGRGVGAVSRPPGRRASCASPSLRRGGVCPPLTHHLARWRSVDTPSNSNIEWKPTGKRFPSRWRTTRYDRAEYARQKEANTMSDASSTRSHPMLRIFLSCTSVDLRRHRHAARRLIEKFDEHPVVMEDFGAQDGDVTQVSLVELASAEVYILLLGWRYGSIPAHETLSVTHLEYRATTAAGIPRLIFFADPTTERDDGPAALFPADVRNTVGDTVRDQERAALLRAFRDEVSHDRVADVFTTPESA